jgi:hypothetical protein
VAAVSKKKPKKFMPLPEDPNCYWFWLQPRGPLDNDFGIKYAPNWEAKEMKYVGPFSFRAAAERERLDRLLSGGRHLKLVPGGKKEAP